MSISAALEQFARFNIETAILAAAISAKTDLGIECDADLDDYRTRRYLGPTVISTVEIVARKRFSNGSISQLATISPCTLDHAKEVVQPQFLRARLRDHGKSWFVPDFGEECYVADVPDDIPCHVGVLLRDNLGHVVAEMEVGDKLTDDGYELEYLWVSDNVDVARNAARLAT